MVKLVHGDGSEEAREACWMTALNLYTRKDASWTDAAPSACVSPLVRTAAICTNDSIGSDAWRERLIGPVLFAPLGTKTNDEDEEARAYLLLNTAIGLLGRVHRKWRNTKVANVKEAEALMLGMHAVAAPERGRAFWTVWEAVGLLADGNDWEAMGEYLASELFDVGALSPTERVNLVVEMCKIGERREVCPTATREEVLAFGDEPVNLASTSGSQR